MAGVGLGYKLLQLVPADRGELDRCFGIYMMAKDANTISIVAADGKAISSASDGAMKLPSQNAAYPLDLKLDIKRVNDAGTDGTGHEGNLFGWFPYDSVGVLPNRPPELSAGQHGGSVKRNAANSTDIVSITATDPDDDTVTIAVQDGFTDDYVGTGNQITYDTTDNKFVYSRVTADEFPRGGITVVVPITLTDDFADDPKSRTVLIPIRLLPSDDNAITSVAATPDGGSAVTDSSGTGTGAAEGTPAVYEVTLPISAHETDTELSVTEADAFATTHWGHGGGADPLTVQPNGYVESETFPFVVEAENGDYRYGELRLTVTKPFLAGLAVTSPGSITLDPNFAAATVEYDSSDIPSGTAEATVRVTRTGTLGVGYRVDDDVPFGLATFANDADTTATFTVDISEALSTPVTIRVTHDPDEPQDRWISRDYELDLMVAAPRLAGLSATGLTGFAAGTFQYAVAVASGTTTLIIRATRERAGQTVFGDDGDGTFEQLSLGGNIGLLALSNLPVGATNARVRVSANGADVDYSIVVTVAAPRFANIVPGSGSPDFVFSSTRYTYVVQSIPANSIGFTVTTQNANQGARWRLAGGAWNNIALTGTSGTFTVSNLPDAPTAILVEVQVTANGGGQIYSYTLHRSA